MSVEPFTKPSLPKPLVDPVLAAIDVGTNSLHMVIVQIQSDPPHFTVLTRVKEMARLGEHVGTGGLSNEAMERAIQALKHFRVLAESYGAHEIKTVATSAVREAANGSEFIARVRKELGLVIDLISGREEARRIYLGVLSAFNFAGLPHAVIDIGGGSTELILGEGGEPLFLDSVKLGAVRLTHEWIHHDPLTREEYEDLQHQIRLRLAPVVASLKALGGFTKLIGTSGTIETLALMDAQQRPEGPPPSLQGYCLTRDRLAEILRQMMPLTVAQRHKLLEIPDRRADVILAGGLILLEAMHLLKADSIYVCEHALREGVVVDWMAARGLIANYARYQATIRERSVRAMAQQYQADWEYVNQVARFALDLFDQAQALGLHKGGSQERHLLWAAAILHNIGHYINHSAHHKHSYYLIRHGGLLGYTEEEVEIIANLARYHRNSPPKRRHESWGKMGREPKLMISNLSALLRLATALDRRRQQSIRAITLERTAPDQFTLWLKPLDPLEDCALEVWCLENKKSVFEAEFKTPLRVICALGTLTTGTGT